MGPFHILLDEMGLDQMGLDQMGLDKVGRQDKLDVQWDPPAYLHQKCGKLWGLQQLSTGLDKLIPPGHETLV